MHSCIVHTCICICQVPKGMLTYARGNHNLPHVFLILVVKSVPYFVSYILYIWACIRPLLSMLILSSPFIIHLHVVRKNPPAYVKRAYVIEYHIFLLWLVIFQMLHILMVLVWNETRFSLYMQLAFWLVEYTIVLNKRMALSVMRQTCIHLNVLWEPNALFHFIFTLCHTK